MEQVEQALLEWISALDVLDDPIFIHDKSYRILRCNRAYQRLAALPFKQIIGQSYFKVFPKLEGPLEHCLMSINDCVPEEHKDDISVDGILYRSRSYTICDEKGGYRYSIHILQDITRQQADKAKLKQNETFIRTVLDNLPIGIAVNTVYPKVSFTYMNDNFPKLYRTTREALKDPNNFWKAVYKDDSFRKEIKQRVIQDTESGEVSRMRWEDIPIIREGEKTTYISAQDIPLPELHSFVSMVWDVTDRKQTEDLLRSEKRFSEKLVENLPDIFFLLDGSGKMIRWNKKVEKLVGMTQQQLSGDSALEFIYEPDRSYIVRQIEKTFETGYTESETRLITTEGIRFYALKGTKIETPEGPALLGIGIDITARREAELQLQRERDFSDRLIDTAPVIVLVLDPEGHIVRYNRYMEELCGYSLEEVEGKDWFSLFLPEATRDETRKIFLEAIQDIDSRGNIDTLLTRSGDLLQIEWYSKTIKGEDNRTEGLISIGIDVTEQRKPQEQLELFHTLFEYSNDAVEVIEPGTLRLLDVNETLCRELGYSRDELLKMTGFDINPTMTPERVRSLEEKVRKEGSLTFESLHERRDGTTYPVELSLSINNFDNPYLLVIARDITERKEAEEALNRANRTLKTLSAANLALVHSTSENDLLKKVTSVIVDRGGYSLAAVDYAEEGPLKVLTPVAWSGFEGEEYWLSDLCWEEKEEGILPAGAAVREGRTQIYRNISDPAICPCWRKASMERGYVSHISLPLFDGERAFGVLSIYSSQEESFDEEEVELLEELARDLAYGILNQRTRADRNRHEELLREGLEQTILAISATVESRDPYTAGHQRRVAELATAIAREMGLDQEETEGIRFAATIHDLGKIHIPAEILSKPGRLSEIEYKLIQTHPQTGYDIIKDVRFPWPIAQIILQHHELLDGSGYPQGLKGDEILLGARVITVADVVEAISSHRPYRSAKGIDSALEEITKGQGIHYDAAVVDACLKLFREKRFTFKTDFNMPPSS